MADWIKWLSAVEKKRLSWLEKRLKEITEEIRRMRLNATQRMARAKRRQGKGKEDA